MKPGHRKDAVMLTYRVAILLALAAISMGMWIQASSSGLREEGQFDRERDFAQYRSYSWLKPQEPARKSAEHIWIVKAVAKKMDERGFYIDAFKPDIQIRYHLEIMSRLESSSALKGSMGAPTDLEANDWALALEIFESETGKPVWRARRTHVRRAPAQAKKDIYEIVERLFEKYPCSVDANALGRKPATIDSE